MLLLVCEDLLDEVSRSGIMSGCGGLGGCIELRASVALQCHVVVENLAHSCTDGERPMVNAGAPPRSTSRLRSVRIAIGSAVLPRIAPARP